MMRMRVGPHCLTDQIMTTHLPNISLNITIYYLDIFVNVILQVFKVCVSAKVFIAILSVISVTILDFMQTYILRYKFDRTNRFLDPENICLDTKIISLSEFA